MFTTCVKEIIHDHDNKQIKVGALLNEVVKHTMPKIDTWEDKIYHHCLMDLDCIYLSSLMLKKIKMYVYRVIYLFYITHTNSWYGFSYVPHSKQYLF